MKLLRLGVVVDAGPSRCRKWVQPQEMGTMKVRGLDRHLDCYYSCHFCHSTSALIDSLPALMTVPQDPTTENLCSARTVRRAGLILYTPCNVLRARFVMLASTMILSDKYLTGPISAVNPYLLVSLSTAVTLHIRTTSIPFVLLAQLVYS